VPSLNGYLAPGPEAYPTARRSPLAATTPPVVYGAKPADAGNLLLTASEADEIRASDPIAGRFIRPLMSATEFLNGEQRYCFWLTDASPAEIGASRVLSDRIAAVHDFRRRSAKRHTREMADRPGLFAEVRRPAASFIFVPRHASASRRLIPMGFVPRTAEAIVHDSGAYIESDDLALFGLLQSQMFAAWQRTVGGRIKSDYRFNNKLVYNTFPFPELSGAAQREVGDAATRVLAARAAHDGASLADLYNPVSAPPELVLAHRALDEVVDAAFTSRRFLTEPDRLAVLFERYGRRTGSAAAR
jgi:hypothetical protein